MKTPLELPLFGFVNPRERLPAFLVPIFGAAADLWIQDGENSESVLQFSTCVVPPEKIIRVWLL